MYFIQWRVRPLDDAGCPFCHGSDFTSCTRPWISFASKPFVAINCRFQVLVRRRETTPPFLFVFLVLPAGLSIGFITVTLPFILTQAGFSVAAAGYVVALGVSANFVRFLWGPVADFTLTRRLWYLIGLIVAAGTLLLVGFIPLHPGRTALLGIVVFVSQVAATLVMLPLGGLMAYAVRDEEKGRTAGWYQAGNLGGTGIGASAGIWLAAHYSKEVAAIGLAAAMLSCAPAVLFVTDVRPIVDKTLWQRIEFLRKDILAIFCSAGPLFITLLIASPIGAGGMGHQWGAVWRDWHANPDLLAMVTGILSGLVSGLGCFISGFIADRRGVWWSYFGAGTGIALVAIVMAIGPRTPHLFSAGVLAYSFMQGAGYAAFSALVLVAIGRGAAATKYALLSSIGNLPVAYMTALDGWVHDRFDTVRMLCFDAFSGLAVVIVAIFVLQRVNVRGNVETAHA